MKTSQLIGQLNCNYSARPTVNRAGYSYEIGQSRLVRFSGLRNALRSTGVHPRAG